MILVDYNAIAIAAALLSPTEEIVRHITLNILRSVRSKLRDRGEMVICCDSMPTWRKGIFPHYKAARKKARDNSSTDWNQVMAIVSKIENELIEHFPYKFIKVPSAEADDVIAAIYLNFLGPHIIVSNDKDFMHLGAEIYSPMQKEIIRSDSPTEFLKQHIILGDMSDGIPNIFSPMDTFVNGERQKPVRRNKLEEWIKLPPEQCFEGEILSRYQQNERLISLYRIPSELVRIILQTFHFTSPKGKRGMALVKYMQDHKLKNLLQHIEDF